MSIQIDGINNFPAGDMIVDCLKSIWGIGLCVTIPTNMFLYLMFLIFDINVFVDCGWSLMQFLLACLCFGLYETTAGYKYQETLIKFNQAQDGYVPTRNVITLVIVGIWCARLFGWIFVTRVCHNHNDPRYEALAKNATGGAKKDEAQKPNQVSSGVSLASYQTIEQKQNPFENTADNKKPQTSSEAAQQLMSAQNKDELHEHEQKADQSARVKFFAFQFFFQALIVVLPATPIYFMFAFHDQQNPEKSWSFWVGIVIAIFGIINVHISDLQVENYRNEQTELRKTTGQRSKGLCRVGWWSKSRHPNLFFEFVTWIGFAIMGIDEKGSLVSLFGFFGPLMLLLVMVYVTIPATEDSMKKSRPNWDELTADTNLLLPFF